MTNMRRGFTMIELVFVIVIIGILAAVALPRFTGISDDAHVSKMQSFVGTLNRTVGPSLWSGVQRNDVLAGGSVATSTYNTNQYQNVDVGVEVESIPSEIDAQLTTSGTLPLGTCVAATTGTPVGAVGDPIPTNAAAIVTGITIGPKTYAIGCEDSDLSQAPVFYLYETTDGLIIAR